MNSPRCVPRPIQRTTTLPPSAITSSMVLCTSGKAEKTVWRVCLKPSRPDPWHGDHTELLQHAQIVPVGPALDDLAVNHAEDLDGCRLGLLPGGCSAHELACVRPCRRIATDYLVPFGDQILNGDLLTWKTSFLCWFLSRMRRCTKRRETTRVERNTTTCWTNLAGFTLSHALAWAGGRVGASCR